MPARPAQSAQPAAPGYPDETAFPDGPAEADEREAGSGPWPAAAVPEAAAAAKPERHSHRASKHGKPSRWRGSGDRPGAGGES